MDKISVVVPVYKVEKYLRQCLDSVVNQTYRDLEIILIDDGSPDSCGDICDEYAHADGRVIVIHKKNGGLSAARNDGISRATGDWIAFVDSDDWIEPDYYERMLGAGGGSSADIILAGGFVKEFPQRSEVVHTFDDRFLYTDRSDILYLMKNITMFGMPWDKLYRRSFIRENGLTFNVSCRAFEDFYFNIQAFDRARSAAGNPSAFYHYRQADSSIATGFNPDKPKINYGFVSLLNSYVDEHDLSGVMGPTVNAVAILAIRVAMACYYFHPDNKKPWRETADELKEMRSWPYYHKAIFSRDKGYITAM